jgi:hypothetical protein
MTNEELQEILKCYPSDVQIVIKICEESTEIALSITRPINNVYPSAFNNEMAISICFESYDEEEND